MIAEVAAVFHWPLAELTAMDLEELNYWQRLAIARLPRPTCAFARPT